MDVAPSRTSNHSAMAPVPMAKARSMPRWKRAYRPSSSQYPCTHLLASALSLCARISLAMSDAHSRQTRRAGRSESFWRSWLRPSTPRYFSW